MLIALPRLDNKKDCDSCQTVLNELENIDDDTDRQGISFIKTQVHIIKLMHVTMIELIFFLMIRIWTWQPTLVSPISRPSSTLKIKYPVSTKVNYLYLT